MLPALALLLLLQDPATDPACTNVRVAIPAELSGWSDQTPITAGTKAGDGATVQVGKAVKVALHLDTNLTLDPKPAKPAEPGTSGGTLQFAVTQAGTYRVALGDGAWIDVVGGGKSLTSTAHAHGPQCTGVRKTVDFKLAPGTYVLQLSGARERSIAAMVVKL